MAVRYWLCEVRFSRMLLMLPLPALLVGGVATLVLE
jgi:hypothetical protein